MLPFSRNFVRRFGSSSKLDKLKRSTNFARITHRDIDHFKSIIPGTTGVISGNSSDPELDKYTQDWLGIMKPNTKAIMEFDKESDSVTNGTIPHHLILRPSTTEQVSKILQHCNTNKLAVVPQGGNTGLVGGSTPLFDEIVLSLERMNKIIDIDRNTGVIVAESGVVLEKANDELMKGSDGDGDGDSDDDIKLLFPLDLGAKGSCTLGGNVSTNAGGLRVLKYGNLHGSVLGVEFVKADGTVVDVLSQCKKDNTGIDLKQLMIGSEGLLGIVTKVSVQCQPLPREKKLLICKVGGKDSDGFQSVVKLFRKARSDLGEILSAFEFWDEESTICTKENLGLELPEFLADQANNDSTTDTNSDSQSKSFYVLIETSGSNPDHDEEKLFNFLGDDEVQSLTNDGQGAVAQSEREVTNFWGLRERISEALVKDGYTYKYDVSIPDITKIYDVVENCRERLRDHNDTESNSNSESSKESGSFVPVHRIVGYGHIGDCNLHLNITSPSYSPEILSKIEPWLWEEMHRLNGSISAEHGVGSMKPSALKYSKKKEAIDMMRSIKKVMDPNGILNPYKMLPEE